MMNLVIKRIKLIWKRRMLVVYMLRHYIKSRDKHYLEMLRYRMLEDCGGMWEVL